MLLLPLFEVLMLRRLSSRLSLESLGNMADIIYSPPLTKLRTELEGLIFSFTYSSASTEFLTTGVMIADDYTVCLLVETLLFLIYNFFYVDRAEGDKTMFLELCDPL